MNTSKAIYTITIQDDMFGEFTGDFEAEDPNEASRLAQEFYAQEMDTQPEEIQILKIVMTDK
jgi:hypothetical protein